MYSNALSKQNKEFMNIFENAFKIKAQLMAFGVNIPAPIETNVAFKPYIKALYDHDIEGASFPYPQEIILVQNGGVNLDINVYAHVRRNADSPLSLVSN